MKKIIISVCVVFLAACQTSPQKAGSTTNVAEKFVAAYNAHDIQGMMALAHNDIKYMFINGDEIYTETDGKAHLNRYLIPFFNSKPKAMSRIKSSHQSGDFIQLLEEAVSIDDQGKERSQCSFSMYQLKDEKIINVWYFDAQTCD